MDFEFWLIMAVGLLVAKAFWVVGDFLYPELQKTETQDKATRNRVKRSALPAQAKLDREKPAPHKSSDSLSGALTAQKKLIGEPFEFKCGREVFSEKELNVLAQYGAWFSALCNGEVSSMNEEQAIFVKDCRVYVGLDLDDMVTFIRERGAEDQIKTAWFKYLFRVKYERENY